MTTPSTAARSLRVGIIGFGWMGQVHARAYTRMTQYYPDLRLRPELVAVADNTADSRSLPPSLPSASATRTPTGRSSSLGTTSTWSA
jgi:predicted dehydrogenase